MIINLLKYIYIIQCKYELKFLSLTKNKENAKAIIFNIKHIILIKNRYYSFNAILIPKMIETKTP